MSRYFGNYHDCLSVELCNMIKDRIMEGIRTECGTTVSKRIRNENDFNRINKEGQLSFSEMIANWVEKLNGNVITDGKYWKTIDDRQDKSTSYTSIYELSYD